MITFHSNVQWSRFVWLLTAVVFIADLLLPFRFDIVFAYLLAHFLAIFFREKSDVLLLVVITTALTVVGAVVKPRELPLEQMLLERLLPVMSCWAAAFFVIRFISMREMEGQQEAKFKALFEYAAGGILLVDQRGTIVTTNPAAEKLFGYASGEMLGQAIEILIPTRYEKRHQQHRENYYRSPNPRSMGIGLDLKGRRKDGTEFPVEVSLSPFKNAEGSFVMAFVVDNTYRKNYENSILEQKQELAVLSEALQDLNEGLENKVTERTAELELAKNELAAALDKERELGELKSRFVSLASHEFRTPLTSVLSSAALAGQYADRGDFSSVKKHTERIKNAVNGLNTILTEFLSLGRLEEGRVRQEPTQFDLPACIEEVHEELKTLFKTGQTLQYTHTGTATVLLDRALLKNILINLISNAIKYSPEQATVHVSSVVDGGKIRLVIRDEGMGIPEADQKHLFDSFFRAGNAGNIPGTGLGLYIVQRYADMMNGRVGFSSEVEKGSEFRVEFNL